MVTLFFPCMHPQLVPGRLPQGISLLNPGFMDPEEDARSWSPDALPLSKKEAKRYVQEALDFGERFKKPKDLAHFGAAPPDDFYAESGLSLKTELGQAVFSEPRGRERQASTALLQGQMTLLLAWVLEERILELQGLGEEVREGWSGLRSSLGLEDEEERALPAGRLDDLFASDSGALTAWPNLLPWFLLFLPRGGQLLLSHPEIKAQLEEWGIEWTERTPGSPSGEVLSEALPGGTMTAKAPGWQLCLAKRPDPERPWLDEEVTVAFTERLP